MTFTVMLALMVLVAAFAAVVAWSVRRAKRSQSIAHSGTSRWLRAGGLAALTLAYLYYERRWGWGAGTNIRLDVFIVLPALWLASFVLIGSSVRNAVLRGLVAIALTLLIFALGVLFTG